MKYLLSFRTSCFLSILMLLCSAEVMSEPHSSVVSFEADFPSNSSVLDFNGSESEVKRWAKSELERILRSNRITSASSDKLTLKCAQIFCGQNDIKALHKKLIADGHRASLSVLILITELEGITLTARDIVTHQIIERVNVVALDRPFKVAFRDAAFLMSNRLVNLTRTYSYSIRSEDFAQNEQNEMAQFIVNRLPKTTKFTVDSSTGSPQSNLISYFGFDAFPVYKSQMKWVSESTPTQTWFNLIELMSSLGLPYSLEYESTSERGASEFVIIRTHSPYLFHIGSIYLFVSAVIYALLFIVTKHFLIGKMTALNANRQLSTWLKYYHFWMYLPFAIPAQIKSQQRLVLSSIKRASDLQLYIEKSYSEGDFRAANHHLLRLQTIDKSHESISMWHTKLSKSEGLVSNNAQSTRSLKQGIDSSISSLNKGSIYASYYYAHDTKQRCKDEQYQEKTALEALIDKISADAKKQADTIGISTTSALLLEFNDSYIEQSNHLVFNASALNLARVLAHEDVFHIDEQSINEDVVWLNILHNSVSSQAKRVEIKRGLNGYVIQDHGTTNGAWLGDQHLINNIEYPLHQKNTITLAKQQEMSPLQFNIHCDLMTRSLSFVHNKQALLPFEQGKMLKKWSNLNLWRQQTFWLVGKEIYLCVNPNQQMEIMHLYQLTGALIVLGKLTFNDVWWFEPNPSSHTKKSRLSGELLFNHVRVIGKVVILNNTLIEYAHLSAHFRLVADEYE